MLKNAELEIRNTGCEISLQFLRCDPLEKLLRRGFCICATGKSIHISKGAVKTERERVGEYSGYQQFSDTGTIIIANRSHSKLRLILSFSLPPPREHDHIHEKDYSGNYVTPLMLLIE